MNLLKFIKPEKVIVNRADDFDAKFEFTPLESGFGVTVGNALRRVLLSSLEGYAIAAIRFKKVFHEFSSIKGVLEDVPEIILNLKQVRLKPKAEIDSVGVYKMDVKIKKRTVFTASMLEEFTSDFVITNPDLVICNIDENANFEMELVVVRGRGYTPSEDHKIKDLSTDYIFIDSVFTPILNVRYDIENTRVEQRTDFEKLILDIKTDGTIHPEYALKQASQILIHHLMVITDQNLTLDIKEERSVPVVDERHLQLRKMLKTPLEDLDLSVRAFNCLKAARINSLIELVQYNSEDLMKFRNFGQKSLVEIEQVLNERGLGFGMDLSKIKIEENI